MTSRTITIKTEDFNEIIAKLRQVAQRLEGLANGGPTK